MKINRQKEWKHEVERFLRRCGLDVKEHERATDWNAIEQETKVYSKDTGAFLGKFVAVFRDEVLVAIDSRSGYSVGRYNKDECEVENND